MKNIIVPTDFSANADNALTYACEMNKKLNANILLLHTYFVPVLVSDGPIMPVADDEIRKTVLDELEKKRRVYEQKFPGMQFDVKASLGIVADEVVAYAEKLNTELVIMGTQGANGLGEFLMGTNTATVIEKTSCPVLAIPEKATFNGLKKIVFAADYGNRDMSHIHTIIDMAKLFDSEIILTHISSGISDGVFEDTEIGRFKEWIVKESNYQKITYRLIEEVDVQKGLNDYLEQTKPDMIVMSMRQRSFIQRLFSRSLTKIMAYHSSVPVLAFHIANQK